MPHIAKAAGLKISAVYRAQSQLSSAAFDRDGPLVAVKLRFGPYMSIRGNHNGLNGVLHCK